MEISYLENDRKTALYEWGTDNPKGVVKIIHGMCEHSGRYDAFAEYLNGKGFAVYSNDLCGHGLSAAGHLGYEDGDMWEQDLDDQRRIFALLKEKHPHVPVYVFAHSYGSFLAQALIAENCFEPQKYVLSGSGLRDKAAAYRALEENAESVALSFGSDSPSPELHKAVFAAYNARYENEGANAWLSRDAAMVSKYNFDEKCGFVCSANFYHSMFKGMQTLCDVDYSAIDKTKRILLLSGDGDPVGDYGAGVKALYKFYANAGIDVTIKLYRDGRHEMLSEINRGEVYWAVADFFQN